MNLEMAQNIFSGYEIKMDGNDLCVYYSKNGHIRLQNADDANMLSKYKKLMIDICALFKWVNEDQKMPEKTRLILKKYFNSDIWFNAKIENDILYIEYMNKCLQIGNVITENMKHSEMLDVMRRAAYSKKRYKELEAELPDIIYKESRDEINHIYSDEIKSSSGWINLEKLVKKMIMEYNEIIDHSKKEGFVFVNENKWCEAGEKILNISEYQFEFGNGITLSICGEKMFKITTSKIIALYNDNWFEKPYESCLLLNKSHYDFFLAMKNYDKRNICINISEDGSFKLHNYWTFIAPTGFEEAYEFVKQTEKNIRERHDTRMLSLISANNISCWKACMDEKGYIDYNGYLETCTRRGIDYQHAIMGYSSILPSIQKLKEEGIVSNWAILGSGYSVEFTDEAINEMKYDCADYGANINNFSFEESTELLPRYYMHEMLKDENSVRENSIQIIKSIGTNNMSSLSKEIAECLKWLDKKYIPLLKLKMKQKTLSITDELRESINDFLSEEENV